MGAIGRSLYPEYAGNVPPKSWYYILAQCDWDSSSTVNALWSVRGDQSSLAVTNEQR